MNVEWGEENRTVGLRVPDSDPQNRRVENRLAGADANPYLALAASLLCGYIGMIEGIKPSAQVRGRAYERRNLRLPLTIEAALERMESSTTLEQYLGARFIRGYVAVKRAEHENYKRVISSWEREFLLLSV
ncbi:Gamma-glutamylputrescine synthetase PuuA [compost metagenome]